MVKALIICAGGMSSSLIAKKATDYFEAAGKDIEVDATSQTAGMKEIEEDNFDLYLVSPQTKMFYDTIKKAADKKNRVTVNIPPQAYVPIPMGTEKLAQLIEENL